MITVNAMVKEEMRNQASLGWEGERKEREDDISVAVSCICIMRNKGTALSRVALYYLPLCCRFGNPHPHPSLAEFETAPTTPCQELPNIALHDAVVIQRRGGAPC